jgi:lysophospholipase L1-like esterase
MIILIFILSVLNLQLQSAQIALTDPNITYGGTLYPEITASQAILYRFPKAELYPKNFSDRPTYMFKAGRSRSGTTVSVKTKSPWVKFMIKYNGKGDDSGAQFCKFMVERNGEFREVVTLNKPAGSVLTVKNENTSEEMSVRLMGPASQPQYILTGIELEDGYELLPPPAAPEKVYVALGDSISHGLRRDNSSETWTWKVEEALGLDFYNMAIGGSNVNPDQIRHVHELEKIDLITWLWGYNDCINRGKTPAEFKGFMLEGLDIVRAKDPKAPIFILNLLQTKSEKSKKSVHTITEFREKIREIVAGRVQAGDENLYLIDAEKMTNKESDLNDVVHLSTEGHTKLAASVVDVIQSQRPELTEK